MLVNNYSLAQYIYLMENPGIQLAAIATFTPAVHIIKFHMSQIDSCTVQSGTILQQTRRANKALFVYSYFQVIKLLKMRTFFN